MKRLALPLVLLTACGVGAGGESGMSTSAGTLGVALTAEGSSKGPVDDGDLDALIVQIVEVRVHGDGGWITINDEPQQVDILRLGKHAAELGFSELPDGHYKQIRLVVEEGSASEVITPDGESHPLKTPSGEQSGLKIKGDFEVAECIDTEVTLALDAGKSIHVHRTGKGDQWILRPVIRATTQQYEREDCGDGEGEGGEPGTTPDPNNPGEGGGLDDPNGGEGGGEGPGTLDPLDPNDPNGQNPGNGGEGGDDPNDPNDPNDPSDPNDPGNGGDDPTDPSDPFDPGV